MRHKTFAGTKGKTFQLKALTALVGQKLYSGKWALVLAVGAVLTMPITVNALPIINSQYCINDSCFYNITFDKDTTGFTLPTGLESLSQLDYYGSGIGWNNNTASYNTTTGLVDIFYSGPTINSGHVGEFAYGVNLNRFPAGTTLDDYNSVDRLATMIGISYDYTNNTLLIKSFDLSSPINQNPSAIPEPASGVLAGAGLAGLLALRRRKQN